MARKDYKPGPGWKHLGAAVYEHFSGLRIHTYGMCRTQSGEWIDGSKWPESLSVGRHVAINGWNQKRGVMSWALHRTRA